jgi:transcriptional regulator with XRE-family HTH domain
MDEDLIYRVMGENIQKARSSTGMHQEELAVKVNLGRTSITNIEKGKQKIQIHTLYSIANALQIPVCDLLPGETLVKQNINQELEKLDLEEEQKETIRDVINKKKEGN